MSIHKKTKNNKRHLDGGTPPPGKFTVPEHTPDYFLLDGSKSISGENNTIIVLGRDRFPSTANWRQVDEGQLEVDGVINPSPKSGNSDRQGAGAIDIVVGRGAPFAFDRYNSSPFTLGPLYNTIPINSGKAPTLLGGSHPGFAMDAARIYISQMCDPDKYFKISGIRFHQFSKTLEDGRPSYTQNKITEDRVESTPDSVVSDTSAIVAKSDKIRLHARQNIKIVTKGPNETVNSQGKSIISDDIGIHLMAGNGQDMKGNLMPQQPMVLGSNVLAAFDAMATLIEELTRVVDNFITVQNEWNGKVANHMHEAGSGPTLQDILLQLQGPVAQLEILTKGQLPSFFGNINLATFKSRFLSPSGKENNGDNNYICSKYNTVN